MCCSKSMALRKRWRASPCAWLQPSCPFAPNLFRAIEARQSDFMKMSELKDKTVPELLAQSRDLRQEIFNLRLQQASSQLEKPARLRTLRRDVARIETHLTTLRKKAA